jgi:hypothetical protein
MHLHEGVSVVQCAEVKYRLLPSSGSVTGSPRTDWKGSMMKGVTLSTGRHGLAIVEAGAGAQKPWTLLALKLHLLQLLRMSVVIESCPGSKRERELSPLSGNGSCYEARAMHPRPDLRCMTSRVLRHCKSAAPGPSILHTAKAPLLSWRGGPSSIRQRGPTSPFLNTRFLSRLLALHPLHLNHRVLRWRHDQALLLFSLRLCFL